MDLNELLIHCSSTQSIVPLHPFSRCVLVMRAWLPISQLGVLASPLMSTFSCTCRSSFYHLRNQSRIRKYLTKESASVAVHAFVTLKLDYGNAFLYGLPKYQLQRLQYVQNTVAIVVCQISKF